MSKTLQFKIFCFEMYKAEKGMRRKSPKNYLRNTK